MSPLRSSSPQAGVVPSHTELRRQRRAALRRALWHVGYRLALALSLGVAAAYGLSLVSGVRWVWWVMPLGLSVETVRLLRARTLSPVSPSGLRIFREAGAPVYLVSAVVGTGIAFWGAFNQSSIAITLGSTFALLGAAFGRSGEPA